MLGNYKSKPVFFNGIQVGEDSSSDDFRVGKHCTGATADGESVSYFWVGHCEHTHDAPQLNVDKITEDRYMLSADGYASLDDWEKLFEDALQHIRELKAK